MSQMWEETNNIKYTKYSIKNYTRPVLYICSYILHYIVRNKNNLSEIFYNIITSLSCLINGMYVAL